VRNLAMDALVGLIADIKAARDEQRRAQFLLDFIEAENSMGFHASQEAMRVLALSLDHARKGQLALKRP
jgi:nitrite reductase (cytochrome c-552)